MMRRSRLLALGLVPPLFAIAALSVLASPALQPQVTPPASDCRIGLQKSVAPGQVQPGDTARVTMVITHTCPDYKLPMDWVFLVDVSNSMTRGSTVKPDPGAAEPTAPIGGARTPPVPPEPLPFLLGGLDPSSVADLPADVEPDQVRPLPTQDPGGTLPGPGAQRPGDQPAGCEPAAKPTDDGGVGTPTALGPLRPRPTSGPPGGMRTPPPTLPPGGVRTPPPTQDPTGVRDPEVVDGEQPGAEDLIRDARMFIREFVDEPAVQRDLKSGHLRLGLVAFNDRGRRLMSLTEDGKRIVSRLGLLRGEGNTRIDLGLRKAEQVLADSSANRARREQDRVRVIVVISDGQFCARDTRVKIDKEVHVITLAAGRSANQRLLREIASEQEFALTLRDLQEVMYLYSTTRSKRPIPAFRPVRLTELALREELAGNMKLVAGSASPPPSAQTGQRLDWVFPNPSSPITVTYDIEPQEAGIHPISVVSQADWKDTEKRPGTASFPEVKIERVNP